MGTYRIEQSYEENYRLGPDVTGPFPEVPATPLKRLLGREVFSRFGISAGLLLNSRWVECYSRLGFDLLTYKTVRTVSRPCFPMPNWLRVQTEGTLPADPSVPLTIAEPTVVDSDNITWTVSFGMPSMPPDEWRQDVTRAKSSLRPGQLLSVSIVGTPTDSGGESQLAEDFAQCAAWAVESGADLIEANFSCPNVFSAEGQVYQNAQASRRIAERIRSAVKQTPLLIKTGRFAERDRLAEFLHAIAGVCDGVVLVNAIQRRVLRPDGSPAFRQSEWAGILGRAIHAEGVRLVESAAAIIQANDLKLTIAGVGGVFHVQDAADYFSAGASAVFAGGSPMTKPTLAIDIKTARPDF